MQNWKPSHNEGLFLVRKANSSLRSLSEARNAPISAILSLFNDVA
jgi:hypothetical protein